MTKFTDEEIKKIKEGSENCIRHTTSHIDPKKFESKGGVITMTVQGN